MILAKPNLLNGPGLLFRALRGVEIVVIDDPPRDRAEKISRLGGGKFCRILTQFTNVSPASSHDRRLAVATWYPDSLLLADLYSLLEPWQDLHYRFEQVDRELPEYALCFRAMICSLRYSRQFDLFSRLCIAEKYPDAEVRLVGFDKDTVSAIHFLLDRPISVACRQASWSSLLANALTAVLCSIASVLALSFFVRVRKVKDQETFLLADYIGDSADVNIYNGAAEYGPVALVARNRDVLFDDVTAPGHARRHRRSDSAIYWREFPSVVAEVLRDTAAIFKALRWMSAREFFYAAMLPNKKMAARALLQVFRPKVFFARDAYNYAHILRHGELKKIGGRHYSVNVGYPAYTNIFPTSRYMSFDTYFGYGRELYRRHYADRWPDGMKVVAAGSFRPTIDQFERSRRADKNGDIAVFTGVMVPEPAMVEFVRTLADALPERNILLQIKPKYAESETGRRFLAECTRDMGNVIQSTDTVYEILERVEYSFTDPGSIVVEAMSMGVRSFLVDVCSWHRTCFYRDYPEVVVNGGLEAAEKVRLIDSGALGYPWEEMKDVADLSGQHFVDRFKEVLRSDFPCNPQQSDISQPAA